MNARETIMRKRRIKWIAIYKGDIARLALGGRHQANGIVEQIVDVIEGRYAGMIDQNDQPIDAERIRNWIDAREEDLFYDAFIARMVDAIDDAFLAENKIQPRLPKKKVAKGPRAVAK